MQDTTRERGARSGRWRGVAVACALVAGLTTAAVAQPEDPEAAIARLEGEIAALRTRYENTIAALEARIEDLERAAPVGPQPGEAPAPSDSLEAARAAARELAGTTAVAPPPPAAEVQAATTGGERNLNRLNPEISFSGDMLGLASDASREEFDAREFELAFQAALDPFTYTKWTLAIGPEASDVELEEGYAVFNRLPAGLGLSAGKFRQTFGVLNRWHGHALPQADYPLVLRTYFGDEGLTQTGLSLGWLVPHPWAGANEITLQITNGENEAFGGSGFDHLAGLLHVKNYWDTSEATYVEWGLSGIAGRTETGGDSRVWGTDITLHWQPPHRAKYREVTFRTEALLSQRDVPVDGGPDERRDAWGLYAYLEGLVQQNLSAGVRYDRVEDPFEPDRVTWGFAPYLTWWQSEYVRLRAEYDFLHHRDLDETERQLLLQLTFAAGPHKHDIY